MSSIMFVPLSKAIYRYMVVMKKPGKLLTSGIEHA